MKMEWKPQPEGLRQILTLLKESQSSETAIQRAVQVVSFSKYYGIFRKFIFLTCFRHITIEIMITFVALYTNLLFFMLTTPEPS